MRLTALALAVLLVFPAMNALAQPLPAPDIDPTTPGFGVQRTMRLLETSTAERPNEVKILFYGQSITVGLPWQKMVAELQARYPHARIVAENRAIGGFSADKLVYPAEHDVYPYYPDLIVFHVYGGAPQYEALIEEVRRRTAAEVLIQGDHVTKIPRAGQHDHGYEWHDQHNRTWFPQLAARLGLGYVPVWARWHDHLKSNNLQPSALLSDGVHLNDRGNELMSGMLMSHLVYDASLPQDEELAHDAVIGQEAAWDAGKLTLTFTGNRVDVPAFAAGSPVEVRIDGKKPSELAGVVAFSRPEPGVWNGWPALFRVDSKNPPVPEDWTLRVTTLDPESEHFAFEVEGSVTGPDGRGRSDRPFVSKSGRVVIQPHAWFIRDPRNGDQPADRKVGHEIRWQATPMYRDIVAPVADAPAGAMVTVAQGFPTAEHTLELIAADPASPPAIERVRTYRPPLE